MYKRYLHLTMLLSVELIFTQTSVASAEDTIAAGELVFADCEEYVNIRSAANEDSEVIAKLYNHHAATIVEAAEDGWYEITSGNVTGYIKGEYLATGEEADAIAEEVAYNVAVVNAIALNIRTQPSEDSEILDVAQESDELEVVNYDGGWMTVALGNDQYGYVSPDYCEYKTYYPIAITLEEEAAAEAEAAAQAEAEASYADTAETANDGSTDTAYTDNSADVSYTDSASDTTYTDSSADASYTDSSADASYTDSSTDASYTDSSTDTSYTDSSADASYTDSSTDTSYTDSSADASYSDTSTDTTYTDSSADTSTDTTYTDGSADTSTDTTYTDSSTDASTDTTYTDGSADTSYSDTSTDTSYTDSSTDASYTDSSTDTSYTDGSTDTASSDTTDSSTSSDSSLGQQIADYAVQFVGNPYVYGGTSLTNGTDCSGFTQSVMAQFGISIPRTAADQAYSGTSISVSEVQAGDLLFYSDGSGISHVALYIGGGQIVHASTEETGIIISSAYYSTPVCAARYW